MKQLNPKEKDIADYGLNMFGHFVSTEARHNLETDQVEIKLVFNNTVYLLSAPYLDFQTEAGCANAWSQLVMRAMLNHERGVNQVQASDEQIKAIVGDKK